MLDTQSIRAAAADTTGNDAGERVTGRKRGLGVDVLGLVVAVVVMAASVHDNAAGINPPNRVAAQTAPVDQGAALGIGVASSNATRPRRGSSPGPSGGR